MLTQINHVAHLADARAIVDAGEVRPRPVYTKSRLKKRVHVSWASANSWSNGSIYGTVEFTFPWAQLIAGRELYWVEAVESYNPTACRFLITDRTPPSARRVAWYDPVTENGPLNRVGDAWHWNPDINAEFMIEAALPLTLCEKASFVSHHGCRYAGARCPEARFAWTESAARFVGYLVGTRTTVSNAALLPDLRLPNGRPGLISLEGALSGLRDALGGGAQRFGGKVTGVERACRLVRAAALQYAFGEDEDARATVALIASELLFQRAVRRVLARHFKVPRKWLPSI